jgi:hypothetical protein
VSRVGGFSPAPIDEIVEQQIATAAAAAMK